MTLTIKKDTSSITADSPRVEITSNGENLKIDDLAIYDEGFYSCKATNDFGESIHKFQERFKYIIVFNLFILILAWEADPRFLKNWLRKTSFLRMRLKWDFLIRSVGEFFDTIKICFFCPIWPNMTLNKLKTKSFKRDVQKLF